MIRLIPRYVYLSPLVFLFIFFCWTINKVNELVIIYLIVIIHELSHIAVAKYYGLKVKSILITPIGINAKIDFDRNIDHNEFFICLAGPISNLVMIGQGMFINYRIEARSPSVDFFILANFAILILNILPVLPLDGGRIFKKILLSRLGYKKAGLILSFFTRTVTVVFICIGIYQLFNCWYNLSLLFIGIFLYLSWYKEKDEIQYSLFRDLIYKNQSLINNKVCDVKYLIYFEEYMIMDIIKNFVTNKYHIIKVFDKNHFIIGELSESQLFESIIKFGNEITLKTALKYYKQSL